MIWLLRTLAVALPVAWHALATPTRDSFFRQSLLEDGDGRNGEGVHGNVLRHFALSNGHRVTKVVDLPDADFGWSSFEIGIWEGEQEVTVQCLTTEYPEDRSEQISQERAERAAEIQEKVWKRDSRATAEIIDTGVTEHHGVKSFCIAMAESGHLRTTFFRALSMPEFIELPKKDKTQVLVQLARNLMQLESAGILNNAISTRTVFLDLHVHGGRQWKPVFMDFGMATEDGKLPDHPWNEEEEFVPSPELYMSHKGAWSYKLDAKSDVWSTCMVMWRC